MTDRSKFLRTALFALVLSVGAAGGVPAVAKTMDMPTLNYPDAGTGWGCAFVGTCTGGKSKASRD